MTAEQAIHLIEEAVPTTSRTWADIGAGSGTFTLALQEALSSGTVYAVDKNPHLLWRLPSTEHVEIKVMEGDFTQSLELPPLDGILMANALHYAGRPVEVLKNVLTHLKPGGVFLLIEYETKTPLPPWIPYPIPFARFQEIALESGLSYPDKWAEVPSAYGHEHIYSASCFREK